MLKTSRNLFRSTWMHLFSFFIQFPLYNAIDLMHKSPSVELPSTETIHRILITRIFHVQWRIYLFIYKDLQDFYVLFLIYLLFIHIHPKEKNHTKPKMYKTHLCITPQTFLTNFLWSKTNDTKKQKKNNNEDETKKKRT